MNRSIFFSQLRIQISSITEDLEERDTEMESQAKFLLLVSVAFVMFTIVMGDSTPKYSNRNLGRDVDNVEILAEAIVSAVQDALNEKW